MNAEEIRRAIEASPLADEVEPIMKWVRPAVRLHSRRTNFKQLPLGASRMGGLPDLPPGVGWPGNPGNDERPLEFLAQIDLAEAARVCALPGLPAIGWFAVFYDLNEGSWGSNEGDLGAWRLIYFAGEADKLIRAKPGAGEIEIFQPCALSFEREFLLHLDSDEDGPGWMWGDAARLYFWMCRGCREVGSLEHVWCTLECYSRPRSGSKANIALTPNTAPSNAP